MILDLKRQLYISQAKISPNAVADLKNPLVRDQIESHIQSIGGAPKPGDDGEYSWFFEAVYPSESDRRKYIEAAVKRATPSYGHIALATLMKAGRASIVWTTNFDSLIADACAEVFGRTSELTTITLDAPSLAVESMLDEGRLLEIKLHGDFRSQRLKNTAQEIMNQDERFRQLLISSCQNKGLVVVGYSGRDNSIIEALFSALSYPNPFPSGLFWLHSGETNPNERVVDLIQQASSIGVEAAIVPIYTFDEIMRDVIRVSRNIDLTYLDRFGTDRRRRGPAPRPSGPKGWPVIRLNAVPVLQIPHICRHVTCQIGGTKDVRTAIENSGSDILGIRVKSGVLAFGSDREIRAAFEGYNITGYDVYEFGSKRLRYESSERGLLLDALSAAITRKLPLRVVRNYGKTFLVPSDPESELFGNLSSLVGGLHGKLSGTPNIEWFEGLGIRFTWANDKLFLVISPSIVFEGDTREYAALTATFGRERTVKRYNRQLNALIEFWSKLLSGDDGCFSLGVVDGIDAKFQLGKGTAFSWRLAYNA